jgi:IclR family transcriptional regulator, mhp operon transcriptional activator
MATTSYHRVRGLEKGLAVLRALSSRAEGTAAEIASATNIPRPTAHRLLETLMAAGYVAKTGARGMFRLTPLIRLLGGTYRDDDRIADIGEPILRDLSTAVVWPMDIATYHAGMMTIRASTHSRSPLSVHRGVVGTRFPMLTSSVGLTYLAFCPAAERREILRALAAVDRKKLRGGFRVDAAVREIRTRGYGLRTRSAISRTCSISVPVTVGERVLACLAIVWLDSAMTVQEAAARFVPLLQRAARRIEKEYRAG